MSVKSQVEKKIPEALKKKEELRLSTLRLLSSALHNEEIAKQKELTQDEEVAVVRREAKQRQEAIEAYQKGGDQKRAEKEQAELEILQEFAPKQLAREEIEKAVEEAITASGEKRDFGFIMGQVMGKLKGRADGKLVAQIVKEKL